jgi:hypothetical protein
MGRFRPWTRRRAVTLLTLSRKDEPPKDVSTGLQLPAPSATPTAPTASDYRSLLVKHRRTQLQNIRANVQRLAETYDRAADIIVDRVRALPDTVDRNGIGWLKAQLTAMRGIREELERLRNDYGHLLDLTMISSAQDAADREAEVARLVGANPDPRLYTTAERSMTLSTGTSVSVEFGTLAKEAVESVANRYYRDGLKLSDRLWNLSVLTRQAVENTIAAGLASGESSRDIAKRLQSVLQSEGVDTPLYRTMRIARSETNNAFKNAHLRSVIDPVTGGMKSYILGIRWSLSTSHKDADMCDLYAAHDEGLGPGIYRPDTLPVSHPQCMCYTSSVLSEFPEVGLNEMEPDTSAVPESMVAYYAETIQDPVAIARLAQVGK